ncbi:efflux RND transporter periplasmic adaptor subunit [Xanthomonadaceae bacterium JHOS43]|nr:efflux RND transporter periplasmic adaptor subunit [Xanthomonadaceae bacterium JHOS43]MCX7562158.1 efflux RND transporter periplasmic adaptor subunit [Xanthomonadaceae bacterium XH05]
MAASFLAGGVMLTLAACSADAPDATSSRPAMVVRAQPAQAAVQIFSGEVRARQEPALAFRVGGKMSRRFVDAGARVRAGDLLAELDPRDLRLQAEAAQAQLSAAQAELSLARAELERHAGMLERGLVSQSLFDAKQAAFTAAQAQANNARAQLTVMRNQREYARLTAPMDGTISARLAEAGQVVAAGQTVFVLAADGEREVAISLPELMVGRFEVGTPVAVELWSRPGTRWPGTVRELSPAADPAARTFAARVAFDAPDTDTELGQSARVYAMESATTALAVPLAAVGGEAGDAYVYVLDPATSTAQRRMVQVMNWGERDATISEGVSPQDWIVAGGVHLVREGEVLRAVDRDNRAVDLSGTP